MRFKVPWSEIAVLGALYAAIAAWSTLGARDYTAGAAIAALGVAGALAARGVMKLALASARPRDREMLLIATGFAAVAVATTAGGDPPATATLAGLQALCLGASTAAGLFLAQTFPATFASVARPAVLALAAGGAAAFAMWRRERFAPWGAETPVAAMVLVALTLAARLQRPAPPEERARLVLPLAGTALAVPLVALGVAGRAFGVREPAVLAAAGTFLASVGLALGVGGLWLRHVGVIVRGVAAVVAGGVAGTIALRLGSGVGVGATVAACAGVGALGLGLRGRNGGLARECARASEAVRGAERVADIAAVVLEPLRAAARDLRAPAALWVTASETRYALDVAGAAVPGRLGSQAERAVVTWLRARLGEVACADALRPQQVRRPELRAVVAALDEHGALAAVPVADGDELAGVLLVPRGRRRALPSYAETQDLLDLARHVARALALASALERTAVRTQAAQQAAAEAESTRAQATAERDVAVARARAVRAVRTVGSLEATWVGYSEAMRALDGRARALAATAVPVALVAEPGAGVAAVARLIHDASPCAAESWAVLDAAAVHPRDALAMLLGDAREPRADDDETPPAVAPSGGAPGWLELVGDGTLVVQDLPALGAEAHAALLEALRTGRARRVGAEAAYDVRARVVVTSRTPLDACGVARALCERFAQSTLVVPPLRVRGEDLETLVLLGIDRACRVAGRPVVGIAREALAALRAYPWPGNVAELYETLEHAVGRARGAQLVTADLPDGVRPGSATDSAATARTSLVPLAGEPGEARDGETYDGLERRILENALERASGNKSEAARALGLARTTFLDKLRKHGLRA